MRSPTLSVAALLIIPWFIAACGKTEAPPAKSTADPPAPARSLQFVGRQTCLRCHKDLVEAHSGSHHDLAMDPANADTVLADFDDTSFSAYGLTTNFSKRGDDYFVITDGPDGEVREYPVTHTFGVHPLQQYLVEMPDGRLQALSVCWDARSESEGGQRWFHLYPDERIDHTDELHWTRPLQNWNHMCAECHSTDLKKNYRAANERFETTWEEIDVSCEACHGPASRHVEWADRLMAGGPSSSGPNRDLAVSLSVPDDSTWIFDDGAPTARRTTPFDSSAQIDTCGRCHSRRGLIWPDYEYGRPLADTHRLSLLEAGRYHADGQILDEVYVYGSFLQSRMYHAGVTCTDCHDPHLATLIAEGNTLCGRCHQPDVFDVRSHHHHEPDSAGAQCVACHMPDRHYMVVDPRHDHSFRVPRPDLTVTIGTPNACNECHSDQSPAWASDTVRQWLGPDQSPGFHYGTALHAGRTGSPDAERLLIRVIDDPDAPAIARATALAELRGFAGPSIVRAIERGARDPDPLVRRSAAGLLDLIEPSDRLRIGGPLLRDPVRTVRTEAVSPLAADRANMIQPSVAAAFDAAVEEFRAMMALDADRAESSFNLGNLEGRLGLAAEAEAAYRLALAREPAFVPAYVNLADLLRATNRDPDGEQVLRRGLTVAPDQADLHHSLGLLLIRRQQMNEALDHLGRAAELRPNDARYTLVYSVALAELVSIEAAVTVLEDALLRFPRNLELMMALINYQVSRNRRDEALRWAYRLGELAPDDPNVANIIADLERR